MKGKEMTIKQASEYLKTTENYFAPVTIRKAITDKKLPAVKHENAPIPYYTVNEADLVAWASSASAHKPGRKV